MISDLPVNEELLEDVRRILVAAGAAAVCYLIGMTLYIRKCRCRMLDYHDFVMRTYAGAPVPALIRRYYRMEVDVYNAARDHWPFRRLWAKASYDSNILGQPAASAPNDEIVAMRKKGSIFRIGKDRPRKV